MLIQFITSSKSKTISPAEPEDTSTVTPAALSAVSKLEATAPPDAAVSVAAVVTVVPSIVTEYVPRRCRTCETTNCNNLRYT